MEEWLTEKAAKNNDTKKLASQYVPHQNAIATTTNPPAVSHIAPVWNVAPNQSVQAVRYGQPLAPRNQNPRNYRYNNNNNNS